MKTISYIVLSILFISTNICAQMFGKEPEERISNYDVEHYKIEVSLDLERKTLDGIVTTDIRSKEERMKTFKVDAVGMTLKSVKECIYNATDDPKKSETYENIDFQYDGKEITIKIPGPGIGKNYPFKFRIEYSVTDPEKGLYFIHPTPELPDYPTEVWSQGEGEDNRYWFPCYDYPNDKATTETFITVDTAYTTLSNGDLKEITKNGYKATWHWELNHPHSSYLVMLAAGKFDIIQTSADDIPMYYYVPAGQKQFGEIAYKYTTDAMHFFNEYIGYKYPWGRFSQIAVKDFIYGGMENTSAVVLFRESLYDENTEPDYDARGLIAHELSHEWWGDVVTCRNWNEIWLNESFATFYEALHDEHLNGKDEYDYDMLKNTESALRADSLIARRPIWTEDGLTSNTYSKGAKVLDMLRNLTGDDAFRKAMKLYITKHEFKPVTTKDLMNAIEESTGKDYSWFFKEWIFKAGQPEFKVKASYNESTKQLSLTYRQIQRLDTSSVFQTPLNIIIYCENNKLIYLKDIKTSTEEQTKKIKLETKPLNILFNAENKILSKLYFDKPVEMWLYQLKYSDYAIDRINAVRGLKDFLSMSNVLEALLKTLNEDKYWGTRYEAAAMLENANGRKSLMSMIDTYKSESDTRVKRRILNTLTGLTIKCENCMNKDEVLNFMKEELKAQTRHYMISDLISDISKLMDKDKIYDFVTPYLQKDSHNEIVRRTSLDALELSGDERAKMIFIETAKSGSNSRLRNSAIFKLMKYKNDNEVLSVLLEQLKSHDRFIKFSILRYTEANGTKETLNYLKNIISQTKDDELQKRIGEVIKNLEAKFL